MITRYDNMQMRKTNNDDEISALGYGAMRFFRAMGESTKMKLKNSYTTP